MFLFRNWAIVPFSFLRLHLSPNYLDYSTVQLKQVKKFWRVINCKYQLTFLGVFMFQKMLHENEI